MHWIWRSTIAVLAGLLTYEITHHGFLVRSIDLAHWSVLRLIFQKNSFVPDDILFLRVTQTLFRGIFPLVVAFATYGLLTKYFVPQRPSKLSCCLRHAWLWNFFLSAMIGLLSGGAIGSLFIHRGLRFDVELLIAVGSAAVISSIAYTLLTRDTQFVETRYCQCGYNLRGNISGICPECGEKLD